MKIDSPWVSQLGGLFQPQANRVLFVPKWGLGFLLKSSTDCLLESARWWFAREAGTPFFGRKLTFVTSSARGCLGPEDCDYEYMARAV